MSTTFVPFHHVDREWDARFNVPVDEDVDLLLANIKAEAQAGKYRYVMVSGIEVGTKPFQPDYLIRHVHVALVFINRVSKSSILKNLQIKQNLGYYLVPRNKSLPYSGWVKHHKKTESKLDETSLCLYEYGTLPLDKVGASDQVTKRSDIEKKRKLDEIIIEMKDMIERGEDDEAFKKFPRNYLTYGEKLKSIIHQRRDFFKSNGNPHIWVEGGPGTGKSAFLQVVYPDYYNKNLDSKFFDRYDDQVHTHVLLQDVDHGTIEKLGVQFIKSICDEAGYPIDQKYKTPQIKRLTILVTSNFQIRDVLPEDMPGRRENLAAIERRFFAVNIRDLLRVCGVKLLSKYEITQLKKQGNTDPKAIFMAWDYLRDCPTGDALKEPAEYQQMIKDAYYK
nr:MAG: replication protein [Grus japonensis parvo-like hybrid virus]